MALQNAEKPSRKSHVLPFGGMGNRSSFAEAEYRLRRNAIVLSNAIFGVLGALTLPILLFFIAEPHGNLLLILTWLLGPVVSTVVLMKTDTLDPAFVVLSIFTTGLIVTIAAMTGGMESFAIYWLIVVPIQAAFAGRRSIVFLSALPIVAGLGALHNGVLESFIEPMTVMPADGTLGFFAGPLATLVYAVLMIIRMLRLERMVNRTFEVQEAHFRLLADNSTDIITRHEIDGDLTFASPSVRTQMRVEPQKLEGKGFLEHVHVADRPVYLTLISEVVAKGQSASAEFRVKTSGDASSRSGERDKRTSYSWVEMSCNPIWSEGEVIGGVVATTRDITRRRQQAEEIERAHMSTQEISEAKSRFLANMSHELRTPLNAIIGFAEILEQEMFGKLENDKQKEYVHLIRESGAHLLQVVTDILDMSKIESGTFEIVPEPFEIEQLVRVCSDIMVQEAAKRELTIETLVPNDLPEAVADSRALRQVLINLISNAVKFSHSGEKITVGVRIEGSDVVYFVRDRGIGIGPNDLRKLGRPFFQADSALDRRYEGTGLGLSVVKGLVELHGGIVNFESDLGKGTTVSVRMPLDCELEEELESAEEALVDLDAVRREADDGAAVVGVESDQPKKLSVLG